MTAPFVTMWDLAFPPLTTPKKEVVALNREEAQNFIKTYHTIYDLYPSEANIKDHMTRGTYLESVHWLKPFDISWDDEIPLKSIQIVESADVSK